jgi:hypothetical protein
MSHRAAVRLASPASRCPSRARCCIHATNGCYGRRAAPLQNTSWAAYCARLVCTAGEALQLSPPTCRQNSGMTVDLLCGPTVVQITQTYKSAVLSARCGKRARFRFSKSTTCTLPASRDLTGCYSTGTQSILVCQQSVLFVNAQDCSSVCPCSPKKRRDTSRNEVSMSCISASTVPLKVQSRVSRLEWVNIGKDP